MFAWATLLFAIAAEVAATLALKAAGAGRPGAVAVVVLGYAASFAGLALVLRHIAVGTAYAVWAGVGTAAIAAIGIVALGEPAGALKLASIALVVAGVIGLNVAGAH
jgi:small multidrug resistance pump